MVTKQMCRLNDEENAVRLHRATFVGGVLSLIGRRLIHDGKN